MWHKTSIILQRLNVVSGMGRYATQLPACSAVGPRRKYAVDANSKTQDGLMEEQDGFKSLKTLFDVVAEKDGVTPVYQRALLYGHKTAIKDDVGKYSYARLYSGSKKLSEKISEHCGQQSNARVAYLCDNNALHTVIQWACWFSGQVVVPLSTRHSSNLLEYYIADSHAKLVVVSPQYEKILTPIAAKLKIGLLVCDHSEIPDIERTQSMFDPKMNYVSLNDDTIELNGVPTVDFYNKSSAMILYTSGTTGKPKGVVVSHKNLNAQIKCLTNAWQYNVKDCLLHTLPLNHVHGAVNALLCPLWSGSRLIMLPKFECHNVWSHLLNINMPQKDRITLFMGVPTIYSMLLAEYEKTFSKNARMVEYIKAHCEKNVRLMVSGSAPLPHSVFNKWQQISGHKLLERYGMTETGMAISNPYYQDKVRQRIPGHVGHPLPGVELKIVDQSNTVIELKGEYDKSHWSKETPPQYISSTPNSDISGELYVRGPSVFSEYWRRPQETEKVFADGWFKTGDKVKMSEDGSIKILGRLSVDIIKSGGYKLSALEIETSILENPKVIDVAVVGIPDITWGERVGAVVVCNGDLNENSFKDWCSSNLASYAIPADIKFVDHLPRNPLGKVNKKEILQSYFIDEENKNADMPKTL